jgi:MraZ protein
MESTVPVPMPDEIFFLGTFDRPLDEKRRVQIPSEWRPVEGMRFALIVWPEGERKTRLRVLPVSELKELMQVIDSWATDDEDRRLLKQHVGAASTFVTADKVGRICIPEPMAGEAGLRERVSLVGGVDKFEIWNPGDHGELLRNRRDRTARALSRVD